MERGGEGLGDNNLPRPRKGLIGLIGLKKRQNMTIETIVTIEMVADNNWARHHIGLIKK